MGWTPEDYQELFDEYLLTGELPEKAENDCLAGYLKEVLDDPGNRHLCTTDPVWKDLLMTSLLEFFAKLLVAFDLSDKAKSREVKLMDDFLQADITEKRLMWPMIEEDISDRYPQSDVNLKGYVRLMRENRISKDLIFESLVAEWLSACESRTNREKRKLLDAHKRQYRNWVAQAGVQDYRTIKETEEIVFKYPQLQEIIRMMGRDKEEGNEVDESTITEHIPLLLAHSKSREEVDGICTGNDLNVMVPTEVVWLADPQTEHLFYHKLVSKQLQLFSGKNSAVKRQKTQHKADPKPRLQAGPMIVCIDTSGSMTGKPEKIAKSLTMQILRAAKRKSRKCILITFSVRANVLEMTEPRHWRKVREFMTKTFTGGTDGEEMICEVLQALNSEKWFMADVLVISDFKFYFPTTATLARMVAEQQKGTRFYGLQIGHRNSDYGRILDRIWMI